MARFKIEDGKAILFEGTTEIFDDEFERCEELKSIEIPASVTKIGFGAFFNCTNLTAVKLPTTLEKIGECAFKWCENLESIDIPNSVTEIGDNAFESCHSLSKVTLSANLSRIESGTFRDTAIEEIDIPDSVTKIGDNAFESCHKLSKVRLSANLSKIEGGAFRETAIEEIEIPNSVKLIEDQAFGECYYLHDVRLPNDIEIADSAFEGCGGLTAVDAVYLDLFGNPHYKLVKVFPHAFHYSIPDNVVEIGNNVLEDCDNIDSVVIPDSVKKIHSGAFSGSKIRRIKIGNGVTELPAYCFSHCELLEEVDISDSITSIGQSCFADCISIKSIQLSDNVAYLGANSFSGCKNLQSIKLGNSIENIFEETFAGCSMLTNISLPQNVNIIGKKAFAGCSMLTNISLPHNLNTIDEETFAGCSKLTKIALPQSMRAIGKRAFFDCSSLESVEHSGNISIGIDSFLGTLVKDSYLLPEFKYYGKILPSQWESDTPSGNTMLKVYRGICVENADTVDLLIKDIKENGLYIEQITEKFKIAKYQGKVWKGGHKKLTKEELDDLYSNKLSIKTALEGSDTNQAYFGDYVCALNYAVRESSDSIPIIIEAEMPLDELNIDGVDSFAHIFNPYSDNGIVREIFSEKIEMYYEKYRAEVNSFDREDNLKFRNAIINMAESDNDIVYAFYNNNRVIGGKWCNIFKCAFQAKLPIGPERILSVKVVSNESLPEPDVSLYDFR